MTSPADTVNQVPALQNLVVEVFSCRLYPRQVDRLDLEIFHYVYDNTGPGSKLRMLFIHISVWYGNSDVFEQMAKDMPPVFYEDYKAKDADKARKRMRESPVKTWDLTEFLLCEVSNDDDGIEEAKADVDLEVENECKWRSDSPVEGRQTKRKRTRVSYP
jgi:hypothetical protein